MGAFWVLVQSEGWRLLGKLRTAKIAVGEGRHTLRPVDQDFGIALKSLIYNHTIDFGLPITTRGTRDTFAHLQGRYVLERGTHITSWHLRRCPNAC